MISATVWPAFNDPTALFLTPFTSSSTLLPRFYKAFRSTTKTMKQSIWCEDWVVFTACHVRLRCEVLCLNTPVLFPFGGETQFVCFPFFVDDVACNLCRFFIVLRRMNSFTPIWERQVVLLRNAILVKSANVFGLNNKTTDKTQTLFCFLAEKPNQNEVVCSDSLFATVESKSSPR